MINTIDHDGSARPGVMVRHEPGANVGMLLRYVSNSLPSEAAREEVAAHIEGCPDCKGRYRGIRMGLAIYQGIQGAIR